MMHFILTLFESRIILVKNCSSQVRAQLPAAFQVGSSKRRRETASSRSSFPKARRTALMWQIMLEMYAVARPGAE
jgi:hypothetical protein